MSLSIPLTTKCMVPDPSIVSLGAEEVEPSRNSQPDQEPMVKFERTSNSQEMAQKRSLEYWSIVFHKKWCFSLPGAPGVAESRVRA